MKSDTIDRYNKLVMAVISTFTLIAAVWQILSWVLANTPTSLVQPLVSILLLVVGGVLTLVAVSAYRKKELLGFVFFIISFLIYAVWYHYEASTNERFATVVFVLMVNMLFFALTVLFTLKIAEGRKEE